MRSKSCKSQFDLLYSSAVISFSSLVKFRPPSIERNEQLSTLHSIQGFILTLYNTVYTLGLIIGIYDHAFVHLS